MREALTEHEMTLPREAELSAEEREHVNTAVDEIRAMRMNSSDQNLKRLCDAEQCILAIGRRALPLLRRAADERKIERYDFVRFVSACADQQDVGLLLELLSDPDVYQSFDASTACLLCSTLNAVVRETRNSDATETAENVAQAIVQRARILIASWNGRGNPCTLDSLMKTLAHAGGEAVWEEASQMFPSAVRDRSTDLMQRAAGIAHGRGSLEKNDYERVQFRTFDEILESRIAATTATGIEDYTEDYHEDDYYPVDTFQNHTAGVPLPEKHFREMGLSEGRKLRHFDTTQILPDVMESVRHGDPSVEIARTLVERLVAQGMPATLAPAISLRSYNTIERVRQRRDESGMQEILERELQIYYHHALMERVHSDPDVPLPTVGIEMEFHPTKFGWKDAGIKPELLRKLMIPNYRESDYMKPEINPYPTYGPWPQALIMQEYILIPDVGMSALQERAEYVRRKGLSMHASFVSPEGMNPENLDADQLKQARYLLATMLNFSHRSTEVLRSLLLKRRYKGSYDMVRNADHAIEPTNKNSGAQAARLHFTAPPYRGQHALQVLRQLHNLTGALFAHAKSANGFPMTDNERALASIWVDFEREANAYVDGSMGVKVEYPISCGVVGGASLDSQNFHFHPSPGLDIKNLQTYSHAVFSRHSGHVARALGGTMSRVIEGIKREED